MPNEPKSKRYDLEERTAIFGENVISLAKKIANNKITERLIPQLVGAGTAVGSNYCEADCAESNKDFIHKMAISNKEAKEAKHFLRMIARAVPEEADTARKLWKEANELNMILVSIIRKARITEEKRKLGA